MNTQRGSRGTALFILNLGTRWGWVVNATPQPLYLQEIATVPSVQDAAQVPGGLEGSRTEKNLSPPPGFEPRTVQHTVSRRTNNAIPAIITIVLFEIPPCALQTIHGQM
jgi:hypothetical protein